MPNPLLNRRDITEQRNDQAAAQATPPGSLHPLRTVETNLAATVAELHTITELMRRQLLADRVDVAQLCVTDREPAQAVQENFPVPGSRRLIVRRTGNGGTYSVPATTPTLITSANEARLGGTIVVSGAVAVTLLLTVDQLEPGSGLPLSAGVPQIWLPPSGGQRWDFLLGNLLWSGNVLAYATGPTTVTVAEM